MTTSRAQGLDTFDRVQLGLVQRERVAMGIGTNRAENLPCIPCSDATYWTALLLERPCLGRQCYDAVHL
jgi:hypothetical protein